MRFFSFANKDSYVDWRICESKPVSQFEKIKQKNKAYEVLNYLNAYIDELEQNHICLWNKIIRNARGLIEMSEVNSIDKDYYLSPITNNLQSSQYLYFSNFNNKFCLFWMVSILNENDYIDWMEENESYRDVYSINLEKETDEKIELNYRVGIDTFEGDRRKGPFTRANSYMQRFYANIKDSIVIDNFMDSRIVEIDNINWSYFIKD